MAWQLFDTTIIGNQSQVLLDDQYISDKPGAALPNLATAGQFMHTGLFQPTKGNISFITVAKRGYRGASRFAITSSRNRIEYDTKEDPQWSHYFAWFKEAPNA
jgi:hypothetical protein